VTAAPRYGTLDLDYVSGWLHREDDARPMWALNLMKYRELAAYEDGRASSISGWEADDLYKPDEPLRQVGADIALIAPVLHHVEGDGTRWDRVAIARYPSRKAMLEMHQLPEFQELHVHKDAAMAFTIVTATFPRYDTAATVVQATGKLLLQLVADPATPELGAELAGAAAIGRFDVEGVVIGDDRRWAEARWHLVDDRTAAELAARPTRTSATSYALLLEPELDRIVELVDEERRAR
jgi:hypothetical protein